MFKNKYSAREPISCETGSPVLQLYVYEVDEDGNQELIKSGFRDMFGLIQSNRDYSDIGLMVERFIGGDPNALNRRSGFYGDVVDAPSTLAEQYAAFNAAKEFFYSLPDEIKDKFNNSPSEFFDSYGSDDFIAMFDDDVVDPVADPKEGDVIEPTDNE